LEEAEVHQGLYQKKKKSLFTIVNIMAFWFIKPYNPVYK
jgi:hypothetical protein